MESIFAPRASSSIVFRTGAGQSESLTSWPGEAVAITRSNAHDAALTTHCGCMATPFGSRNAGRQSGGHPYAIPVFWRHRLSSVPPNPVGD